MGWKGESRRHSLARRGVKTNIDGNKRFAVNNFVAKGQKVITVAVLSGSAGKLFIEKIYQSELDSLFDGDIELWLSEHGYKLGDINWQEIDPDIMVANNYKTKTLSTKMYMPKGSSEYIGEQYHQDELTEIFGEPEGMFTNHFRKNGREWDATFGGTKLHLLDVGNGWYEILDIGGDE